MIDPWIYALGAILVGFLSGAVGAALVRRIILRGRQDRPEIEDAARATATFLFLFFVAIGFVVAAGVMNPEELEPIPVDLLRKSPAILAAGLILIAGRAIALAVGGAIAAALHGATPRVRRQVTAVARTLIYFIALVLALAQVGVDTTILSLLALVTGLAIAGAFTLIVGLGGRDLGAEIAAGRHLQRLIEVGDRVRIDDLDAMVVAMHPASVEFSTGAERVHLANTTLTRGQFRVVVDDGQDEPRTSADT